MNIIKQIASELKLNDFQVKQTIDLLDNGNTVPFISRYRKEATGELDEVQIRKLATRLQYLRNLQTRKTEILHLISEQNQLTDLLEKKINQAITLQQLADIYRPYRPKRKTRASIAKENGLEPLAKKLLAQMDTPPEQLATAYLTEKITSIEAAINGASDILAEQLADDAQLRHAVREYIWHNGSIICSATTKNPTEQNLEFKMYFDYQEPLASIPPHRLLAINRGEQLKALRVKLKVDPQSIYKIFVKQIIPSNTSSTTLSTTFSTPWLKSVIKDSYNRLLAPSIEREIRHRLTETAQQHGIDIFAKNLHNLLLQAPVRKKNILGIDPAYRTGCKIATVNEYGDLLTTATIYPHAPHNKWRESLQCLTELVKKYKVSLIVIGNGTACRETEKLIAELIKSSCPQLKYLVVNEAGASIYSASELARQEFPKLDVSIRGAVSIARRVLDPLAELVKIDPKSIGVGLYQYDIPEKSLDEALDEVVESCVNYVGVELNSASPTILKHVAGLTNASAEQIIAYRQHKGAFFRRSELKRVKGLGPKTFKQCAGFLRISQGDNPLDNTAVHPESYPLAHKIIGLIGYQTTDLLTSLPKIKTKLYSLNPKKVALSLNAGEPTVRDIIAALAQPSRDPREQLPPPLFKVNVLTINDLKPGMILKGSVQNVVDFGIFVDIGIKKAGLVHISEISTQYINHPTDAVQVADIVTVKVLAVDRKQARVSLTMKIK